MLNEFLCKLFIFSSSIGIAVYFSKQKALTQIVFIRIFYIWDSNCVDVYV